MSAPPPETSQQTKESNLPTCQRCCSLPTKKRVSVESQERFFSKKSSLTKLHRQLSSVTCNYRGADSGAINMVGGMNSYSTSCCDTASMEGWEQRQSAAVRFGFYITQRGRERLIALWMDGVHSSLLSVQTHQTSNPLMDSLSAAAQKAKKPAVFCYYHTSNHSTVNTTLWFLCWVLWIFDLQKGTRLWKKEPKQRREKTDLEDCFFFLSFLTKEHFHGSFCL